MGWHYAMPRARPKCGGGHPLTLEKRGAEAVIPSKADRKQPIPHDRVKYRWRHLIENYFSKIKDFRSVNTRYDKTDLSYKATINLAAIVIALR